MPAARNRRIAACYRRQFERGNAGECRARRSSPASPRRNRRYRCRGRRPRRRTRRSLRGAGVLGRVAHAEIEGEAGQKDPRKTALAQIADQAGRRRAVVLEEGRIGIDRAVDALAQHKPAWGTCSAGWNAAPGVPCTQWSGQSICGAVGRGDGVDRAACRDGSRRRKSARAGASPASAPRCGTARPAG